MAVPRRVAAIPEHLGVVDLPLAGRRIEGARDVGKVVERADLRVLEHSVAVRVASGFLAEDAQESPGGHAWRERGRHARSLGQPPPDGLGLLVGVRYWMTGMPSASLAISWKFPRKYG